MIRTDVTDVRVILPASTQLTDVQIQASINAASCIVDRISTGCAKSLSDDCLKNVETYLSAHYAAATENMLSISSESNSCIDSKTTYGFEFGRGINGTVFGQMANTLSGGCLELLDKKTGKMLTIGCI